LIELSRPLARAFRAVMKKMTPNGNRRDLPTVVGIRTDRNGLHMQAQNSAIVLEHTISGSYAATEEIALPAEALGDFEAKKDSQVRIELKQGVVVASWQDKVPQLRQYQPGTMPQPVASPTHSQAQPANLLTALQDARDTASDDAVRYASNCLQLRGKAGQIVGTDGRQMLVLSGFTFGWDDDVLIPATPIFGCRELYGHDPVHIGRSDKYVTITVGPWMLHLAIQEGRFPNVDHVLPDANEKATVLNLDPGDREFLLGTLGSLPGGDEEYSAVTVEGNGQVCVRAKSVDQPTPTEIVLARSSVQGKKISFATSRCFLGRVLALGFNRISVFGPERPVLCRDDRRQFIWQPLEKKLIVDAGENVIRVSSADSTVATVPAPVVVNEPTPVVTTPIKDEPLVQEATPSETVANGTAEKNGIAAVLDEAEAIKDVLRQAYTRMHQLVIGVKRYRKQAQMVKSALGSLRQLQEVAE
jgi:hypothetical protein